MGQIVYTDTQIVAMSEAEVKKLGLLCPKHVYYQMETSGSPSAWTNNGEYLAGNKGADIVRCAMDIRETAEEVAAYNDYQQERNGGYWSDNYRNYDAHIRVVF